MLGHPETPVTEGLDMPRQIERIAQCLPGIAPFGDRGKIQNGKWDHRITMAPDAASEKPLPLVEIAAALNGASQRPNGPSAMGRRRLTP